MTSYSIEPAKSGRSSCKKCKDKIEKDDLRIGTSRTTADDITMTTWVHAKCFTLPRKSDPRTFLSSLDMSTLTTIQKDEVEKMISELVPGAKRKIEIIDANGKKIKVDETANFSDEERVIYEKYKPKTVEELKDYMRWNNQPLTGTKIELIKRCIDGELHGALPQCPQAGCGGRLKYDAGNAKTGPRVSCAGAFNEELGTFVRCYFRANANTVKRVPWRESPRTDDEIIEDTKFHSTVDISIGTLLFEGLDITTIEGKKECINRFIEICSTEGINIPENPSEARVKLGTLLMNNSSLTGPELVSLAEETYGTIASNQAKLDQSKTGTVNPANEGLVTALSELSDLYFKTGNAQVGNIYRKAVAAIREYNDPITSGKTLGKGKGKIEGIGARTGEIIDEYLETGTIAKIQEKKAELSL